MRTPRRRKLVAAGRLTGRVVVVSPHLDDAVFSLGAAIRSAVTAGAKVTIVTVFAGDPGSTRPASAWDRRSGFAYEGDAVRARRSEDAAACRLIGANPVWLPFAWDHKETADARDELWSAIDPCVRAADILCVPGFPLGHPDHALVGRLVLERAPTGSLPRLALYVEQPYAVGSALPWRWAWNPAPPRRPDVTDGVAEWTAVPAGRTDRRKKLRACRAYGSQLTILRKQLPLVLTRIALFEARRGGESLAWVT